jgi:hypothetical protein
LSSSEKLWSDGEAHTTVEHQRVARIAAQADDRALEALLTPHGIQKRILPLSEETPSVNPRLLIVPSPSTGAVRMRPARLLASGAGPFRLSMSATVEAPIDSPLVGANATGQTRFDLVYASMAYAISAQGTRKVKDVSSGIISPQVLPLERAPRVALAIIPGISTANPLGALPADAPDGTAFNFPVALVTVPTGHVAGQPIPQAQITQQWPGGAVDFHRVRVYRPGSIFGSGINESQANPGLSDRWGFGHRVVVAFRHMLGTTQFTVDDKINWARRAIVVTMLRAARDGTQYKPAHQVSLAGGESQTKAGYTGMNGAAAIAFTFPGQVGSKTFGWFADANSGVLLVSALGQVDDQANGDHYLAFVEATDRFDF